jgi:hypothetical protein
MPMFTSSLTIRWHVPLGRPNLTVFAKMALHWSWLTILQTLTISVCATSRGMIWMFVTFNKISLHLNQDNNLKVCIIPVALSLKPGLIISPIYNTMFLSLWQSWMQMHFSAIIKSQIALNMHNSKQIMTSNGEGKGHSHTKPTQKRAVLWHLVVEL